MNRLIYTFCWSILLLGTYLTAHSQTVIKGKVIDITNGDPLIGASVVVLETQEGVVADWDGSFELPTKEALPLTLEFSYIGYSNRTITVDSDKRLTVGLEEDVFIIEGIEVTGTRISDKQKESPLTVEALDLIAIKETPSSDFYAGLGALKGVDLTTASLGFKVVNTRGFNSTSPVRSLQIIDGIDNQAPGLNFSLGNFLGSSELDVNKVELIVGASSAFYGPNAFNGVISMETSDPFFRQGLSAMVKGGERDLFNAAIRWADGFKNKNGHEFLAYKFNIEFLRAQDWEADNFDPIFDSRVTADNPGRFDAVNIYGDEYQSGNDFSEVAPWTNVGLGIYYRTGYRERDLVDYGTENTKANVAVHIRTRPSKEAESPELVLGTSYGAGTTVYQGDNRFSLRDITFLQNKIEYKKRNKFFIRAYTTRTGAGDSYDPYFTALEMIERTKADREWSQNYQSFWLSDIQPRIDESDFPDLEVNFDPVTGEVSFDFDNVAADQWLIDNQDSLTLWHSQAEAFANGPGIGVSKSPPFFEPGTARFDSLFNDITSKLRTEGGTRFYDNSALYHVHGEYKFTPTWTNTITVGANARYYTPESRGTVFADTVGNKITNFEFGMYAGIEKSFFDNKVKTQVTVRADKNENYDWLLSPAASIVYTPSKNNYLRVSFSSAIRNPTLSDQFLSLNVGRAILSGNLNGVQNLVTTESLEEFFSTLDRSQLDSFDIAPIRPEQVKTFEVGYRTTLFEKLYLDAGYYYSIYDHFLGFNIGVDFDFEQTYGTPTIRTLQAYRYSANSTNTVTTQGASIGLNYYFARNYAIQGNYSWNKLIKSFEDDPIIPAFNTPEHKYNIGINGRDLTLNIAGIRIKNVGFNVNYKWIEGFLFEGSPQFTGFIPTYDMVDAQVNVLFPKLNTTLKIGASNLLNNEAFQTYGGPRIGRLAYIKLLYEQKQ